MKFIVVGSTGLIGSYVAKTLSKYGTVVGVSRTSFKDKALGQVELVRVGIDYLTDGGSFTLMTGVLARDPIPAASAAALANGAVESFTLAAAIDLPRGLRINTVSPNVLIEATSYHAKFAGYHQVSAQSVADAYVKSILGKQSGQIYKLD
jgi:NAD(P)-dependent dehydrogenase (short-subunit alcohol dehydrogenase family)